MSDNLSKVLQVASVRASNNGLAQDTAAMLLKRAAQRIDQLEAEAKALNDKAAHDSWAGEVDRQGGSFTQDEIDRSEGRYW